MQDKEGVCCWLHAYRGDSGHASQASTEVATPNGMGSESRTEQAWLRRLDVRDTTQRQVRRGQRQQAAIGAAADARH